MTINGSELVIETGRVAKQSNGSVMISHGDTVALVTACANKRPTDRDFLPLFVEFRERSYAAGKIPGGFFKRESRPSDRETLSCRLIDRPLRPLFPKHMRNEVQIASHTVSHDGNHPADVMSITGASCALALSDIPCEEIISAVRVGLIEGEFVANPTFEQQEESLMDLIVAGSDEMVMMIEGGCEEVSEDQVLDAIEFGHAVVREQNTLQRKLVELVGGAPAKFEVPAPDVDSALMDKVKAFAEADLAQAITITAKLERQDAVSAAKDKAKAEFLSDDSDARTVRSVKGALGDLEKSLMRNRVIKEKVRVDGRDLTTVRPIEIETGVLPRAHGSALFTRGETQALVVTTLGTQRDEQRIDALEGESWKSFMLHYNFPPFSVGEVGFFRGAGRREIGHGMLAERSLEPMVPANEDFPYTIRLVSDIMESNGSSSMASVCGGSLAMMDAGVPMHAPVAGVAMGLIKEGDEIAILTDILGVEDHLGDMDFKVTGTEQGITAFQLDTKISGLTREIMRQALEDARNARLHILGKMNEALPAARPELSQYAPKISTIQIPTTKIGELIGPGGKNIKRIQEETGANVEVNDDGIVFVSSPDQAAGQACIDLIAGMMASPEVGKTYNGKVKRITDFGAFVEILPNKEGLLHISEVDHKRIAKVDDVIQEGEMVDVVVLEVDQAKGRIRLSRKALLEKAE
ncbi:polyribonucleotide nucleotidyltransferase [bacterium]|nr:MAG: polyribonucleotide nucleotidyltransferase [bacterium]